MLISILPDADAVALKAADFVASLVRAKPAAVLGLAAGATPLAAYGELVRRHRAGAADLSSVTIFGLDEYLGLGTDHPASCAHTLRRHFTDPLGLPEARVHLFDGKFQGDFAALGADYEARIAAAGGLDLQILGLGVNGHIGFNEPGCSLDGSTHRAVLRSSTRDTNLRTVFAPLGETVPPAAVTMGVGTIRRARRILMLATGGSKAEAAARAVEGPVAALVPASALQLHADTVWLLDEAAAAKLALKEDYRAEAEFLIGRPGRSPESR